MLIWNSKKSTYYGAGKRAYSYGDEIPKSAIDAATLQEYIDRELIKVIEAKSKVVAGNDKEALLGRAKELGLSVSPRTGVKKLHAMIEKAEAAKQGEGKDEPDNEE